MVKDEKTGMTGNFTTTRKEPTWPEFVQYLLKTSVARYTCQIPVVENLVV